jgi:hypothetical protein
MKRIGNTAPLAAHQVIGHLLVEMVEEGSVGTLMEGFFNGRE